MEEQAEPVRIDCQTITRNELGARLRDDPAETVFQLMKVSPAIHGFAAGVSGNGTIDVQGSVGDFPFLAGEYANVEVTGNAGDGCAHSMASGRLLIRGSVGNYLGAFASGGFIAVHGQAEERCGFALAGAEMFVRSTVGDEAGARMTDGVLVLGNGAGNNTGLEMQGGMLYIRGEVESLAESIRLIRMKEADSMRLSLLLARAGIKGGVKEFKAYRPKSSRI